MDKVATVSVPLDLTVIADKVAAILDGKQEARQDGYMNVATALDFLGWGMKGRDRLYDYIAVEAIPFHRVGRRYFFDRDELRGWVKSNPAAPPSDAT
jgi:hypothetical protein